MSTPSTLVELIRRRVLQQSDRIAFTFLHDGENEHARLTFGELGQRARAIAAQLQKQKMSGKPVLLLFPSGLDFITAFVGCLYAGAIATPAHVPRLNRNLLRLRAILADAKPEVILTTRATLSRIEPMLAEAGLNSMRWIEVDAVSTECGRDWREPAITRETLALLQYTSGSTSTPKGIMVNHANLLANHRMLQCAFEQNEESTIVTWLPLFHDMGLIGKVLQSLYLGAHCVLMPPECFLVKPLRWLEAISRYRAHTSGAPNFAFDLCCRRTTPEQRAALDLSCWQVAFNGSEPVRSNTLATFSETFASNGFRASAFYPCYGLAEATLFVSGGSKSALAMTTEFDAASLQNGEAVESFGEKARALVSCGHTWLEQRIAIVDAETQQRCPPGKVGEIWVSGPNVAQGYWNQPEATARDFQARLADSGEGPFLRTGDSGCFYQNELFIAGRLKDLIIIAGRNHDPADIEQTVEASHPTIRRGCCAAFPIEFGGDERLVIAAELQPRQNEVIAIRQAIRQAIAETHDLSIHAVELLAPATIPKTSSGKVQRRACRADYLAGNLQRWKDRFEN